MTAATSPAATSPADTRTAVAPAVTPVVLAAQAAQAGQVAAFIGVWTDRNDGGVRFLAAASSVEEAMAKVDAAWCTLNDMGEGESPFNWRAHEPRWNNPSVTSAIDYDDYVQVVPLA